MSIRIGNNVITGGGGSGSDPNFLPNGTILTVELDGSGQFTKLSQAINFLHKKWSNGTVIIQLGEGEFIEENTIYLSNMYTEDEFANLNVAEFNIPTLKIIGRGKDVTSLSCSNTADYTYIINCILPNLTLNIRNMTLKGNIAYKLRGIEFAGTSNVLRLDDVNLLDFERGALLIREGSTVTLGSGTIKIGSSTTNKCNTGVQILSGGALYTFGSTVANFQNIKTCLSVNGGILSTYPGTTFNFTNITNKYTNSNNSLIMSSILN